MKRDMDLIRKILLAIEGHEHGFAPSKLTLDDYSAEQVGFHVLLMSQAGFLKAADITPQGARSPVWLPQYICWAGYEFLEAARKPAIWDATKRKFADAGVGFSIELMKGLLLKLSKQALGLDAM